MRSPEPLDTLVIGGGPAGLMAAGELAAAGRGVVVAEARPSVGRKLLMAGKSGLNLTMDTGPAEFAAAFSTGADWLAPLLTAFGPAGVSTWAKGLGIEVFTGSSGRVFPVGMKASPLLRAWLARLSEQGVALRTRWRWEGFDGPDAVFATPGGERRLAPRATVLALGGGSWARLGSDGAWTGILAPAGVPIAPFRPSNVGFLRDWSPAMARHFGAPVKPVRLMAGGHAVRGEFVISARGVEGGGIYALGPALRDGADLTLDLIPDRTADYAASRLAAQPAKASLANRLRRALNLPPVKIALLRECASEVLGDPAALAAALKALPLPLDGPRPLDEAISTAGGVMRDGLDENLMLRARPGAFAAGEMLDWDAPTGGYLLTACLATGRHAGRSAARWAAASG